MSSKGVGPLKESDEASLNSRINWLTFHFLTHLKEQILYSVYCTVFSTNPYIVLKQFKFLYNSVSGKIFLTNTVVSERFRHLLTEWGGERELLLVE